MRKHHIIAVAYVLGGIGVALYTGAHAFLGIGCLFALMTIIGRA